MSTQLRRTDMSAPPKKSSGLKVRTAIRAGAFPCPNNMTVCCRHNSDGSSNCYRKCGGDSWGMQRISGSIYID